MQSSHTKTGARPGGAGRAAAILRRLFFLAYCAAFFIVLIAVLFLNDRYDIHAFPVILLMLFFLAAIYALYRLIKAHERFFERNFWRVLLISTGFLFILNMAAGFLLRYEPVFDLGAIYTGAAEWAANGSFMDNMNPTCDPDYFYYFPNNLGGMALLFLCFKAAFFFGVTDTFAAAMVMNGAMAVLAAGLTVRLAKNLFGVKAGMMTLALFLMSPPFYFIAPVFYTDSLSMIFPVLLFTLYLKYADSAQTGGRVLFALLMGLTAAIGMLVKFTVLIALIAIVIYELIAKGPRPALALILCGAAVIAPVFALFDAYMYGQHLDREKAAALNTPRLHWVMMSLAGDGAYNPADYAFTRSFDDPAQRDKAIRAEIARRVEAHGITGLADLFLKKQAACFGDGTYAQSDFLDDNPVNDTALHAFLLYGGEHYNAYKHVCAGVFFALQALALCGAAIRTFSNKAQSACFVPELCLFGLLLFFMIWEVSGRYVTNYAPMLVLLAASGVGALTKNHRFHGDPR